MISSYIYMYIYISLCVCVCVCVCVCMCVIICAIWYLFSGFSVQTFEQCHTYTHSKYRENYIHTHIKKRKNFTKNIGLDMLQFCHIPQSVKNPKIQLRWVWMRSIDSPRQKVKTRSPMSSHMERELRNPAVRFDSGVCAIVYARPNKPLQMSSLLYSQ